MNHESIRFTVSDDSRALLACTSDSPLGLGVSPAPSTSADADALNKLHLEQKEEVMN